MSPGIKRCRFWTRTTFPGSTPPAGGAHCEIGAGPGEQEEYRRAEVGNPAREEQRDRGGSGIGGVQAGFAEEVPDVIERHKDHDGTANDADGFDADAL